MKPLALFLLVFIPALGFSQVADSAGVARAVDSLIRISRTLTEFGNFEQAIAINVAAGEIALKHFGRESAQYGRYCYNQGRILSYKEDYSEAEKWDLDAKSIQEKTIGNEHTDYALTIGNLAELYRRTGKYKEAEPLFLKAKSIWEKTQGKNSTNYANNALNFANYYATIGNYETAESLYLESITVFGANLGKKNPIYAAGLGNLATLNFTMGNYAKAEQLNLEAKSIWETTFGKEHYWYAGCLNNLGLLYYTLSQYNKAEQLYLEARSILEKTLGKENRDYAANATNLAILYYSTGQFEKAESFYLESKSILEKNLEKEHADYIANLNDLAVLYINNGDYKKGEQLYFETKSSLENRGDKESPIYASCINNLGLFYYDLLQFKKSETLLLHAKSLREKIFGKEHSDYAASLINLAVMYADMGNYAEAEPLLVELANLNQSLMQKASQHLSERELSNYISKFSAGQNLALSFAQSTGSNKLISTCFNNCLFYKGFLLNALGQIKRLAQTDSVSIEKFNRLKAYNRQLAGQSAVPIADRDNEMIASLEEKAGDIEKDLTRTVAGFGEAAQQVKWQEVQNKLMPGDVVLEFIQYPYINSGFTDSTMYAALVLKPGYEPPQFVPLFEERELESAINGATGAAIFKINALYTGTTGKSLNNLIWKPLKPYLTGAKTIYCSPAGLLYRLNLGAISVNGREIIDDIYQIIILGSTRRLALPDTVARTGMDAMLIGGVRYASDTIAIKNANKGIEIKGWPHDLPVPSNAAASGGAWKYLPETAREVLEIQQALQSARWVVQTDTGYTATEERFRARGLNDGSGSPRILHIATHGFFFPDPKAPPAVLEKMLAGEKVFRISDHPMIRSGLLLAGANEFWINGKTPTNREDGILTAYEISQMNLTNTELVVLSACDTGLGDIEGNEGVNGLQRAFKIAGAKYLIMSLWNANDETTRELMDDFYRQWLINGMQIPQAFRVAQHNMKEKHPTSPFLWAGFVLVE